MENIPIKIDIDQINKESTKRKDSFSENSKPNLSKSQRHNNYNKYNFYNRKDFLKNKRKFKKKQKNEIPDTPHNTGQYLCHIYQSKDPKNKQKKENEEDNDELNLNFFEDDDDDCNYDDLGGEIYDFKFNEDLKRERLMSLEGKDLHDFLFTPEEIQEEQKIFKSAISFDKRNNFNLDSPEQNDEIHINEEKM